MRHERILLAAVHARALHMEWAAVHQQSVNAIALDDSNLRRPARNWRRRRCSGERCKRHKRDGRGEGHAATTRQPRPCAGEANRPKADHLAAASADVL